MATLNFIKVCFVVEMVFLALLGSSFAAEPIKLDLARALGLALDGNMELKAKKAESEKIKGKVTKADLLFQNNPELESSVNPGGGRKTLGNQANGTALWISLSQEVEIAGQPTYRREAAAKELEKAAWDLKEGERQLRYQVKLLFVNLLTLQEKIEGLKQIIALCERLQQAARNHASSANSPSMDIARATFALTRLKSDLLGTQREYLESLADLRGLLNLPADQMITLEGTLKKQEPTLDLERLLESAVQNRPDLAALAAERQSAEAEVNLTRSQQIPNIRFFLSFTHSEQNSNTAGGGISIPIPVFDRKQEELEAALARKSTVEIQYKNLRQTLERKVRSIFEKYRLSEEGLNLFGDSLLEKFRENLDLALQAYDEGKTDIDEVITAQDQVVDLWPRYLDMMSAYHTARIELEREAALNN